MTYEAWRISYQCNRLSGEENEKKLYLAPGAKGEEK